MKENNEYHILELFKSGQITSNEFFEYYSNLSDGKQRNLDIELSKIWNQDEVEIDESHKSETLKAIVKSGRIKPLRNMTIVAAAMVIILICFTLFMQFQLNSIENSEFSNVTNKIELHETPDGSYVRLHPNSKIVFTENRKSREIVLDGKATFDIVSNKSKPLFVETNYSQTRVIGTVFTISTQCDSTESIHLHEGKIEYVFKDNRDSIHTRILKPGSQLKLSKSQKVIIDFNEQNNIGFDRENSIILLNKADVYEVAKTLKVWYGIDILIPFDPKERVVHRIDTKHMNVDEVINSLNLIANYKIEKIEDMKYQIMKK